MFSKTCEYGIRATIYLASLADKNQKASLEEIAAEIDSPVSFTSKILQRLTKNGLLISVKGASGGFKIDKNQLVNIKLWQIVAAIDGDNIYTGCGLGLKFCNAQKPCPLHEKFASIRNQLRDMLENTSLQELIQNNHLQHFYLKR